MLDRVGRTPAAPVCPNEEQAYRPGGMDGQTSHRMVADACPFWQAVAIAGLIAKTRQTVDDLHEPVE